MAEYDPGKYQFVTAMSKAGYEQYGRRLLDSWEKFGAPSGARLAVFSEDLLIHAKGRECGLDFYDLHAEPGYDDFMARNASRPGINGPDYRMQALRFAHKVFAYTSERIRTGNAVVWIDADTELTAPLNDRFFTGILPPAADVSYLGRKDWDHSECGFMVFHTHPKMFPAATVLKEIRDQYLEDTVFSMRESHDSYVFDRVLARFPSIRKHNLSEGVPGLDVWPHTILGQYMKHYKGPKAKANLGMQEGDRYQQLIGLIAHHKPRSIVEVGTWNGDRAVAMIQEARRHQEHVTYDGFDLFEEATAETDAIELNVKSHNPVEEVGARMQAALKDLNGVEVNLHRGNTRETLPEMAPDFAFIDGGQSVETIASDYSRLKNAKVVVLDDYYTPDFTRKGPDTTKYGCNALVSTLDHAVLPLAGRVYNGGYVQMAVVPAAAAQMRVPKKANLVIKTQNCVPEANIQANIRYASTLIQRWLPYCEPHGGRAVMISGGPSISDHFDAFRAHKEQGDRLICVKHAHDILIAEGIVPWACVLLDPRAHVQDFVENPHPDVRYFVASMCHPTTIDRLSGAKVWGYNALVGAEEEKVVREMQKDGILISGGSTSAMRGLALLYSLGFRKYDLYAVDSCFREKPDLDAKTKTGAPAYYEVEVLGRSFWTTAELIAQCQDFEKLVKVMAEKDFSLEVHGDGIIPHIWANVRKSRTDFASVDWDA